MALRDVYAAKKLPSIHAKLPISDPVALKIIPPPSDHTRIVQSRDAEYSFPSGPHTNDMTHARCVLATFGGALHRRPTTPESCCRMLPSRRAHPPPKEGRSRHGRAPRGSGCGPHLESTAPESFCWQTQSTACRWIPRPGHIRHPHVQKECGRGYHLHPTTLGPSRRPIRCKRCRQAPQAPASAARTVGWLYSYMYQYWACWCVGNVSLPDSHIPTLPLDESRYRLWRR
jgi:hypothetical protein